MLVKQSNISGLLLVFHTATPSHTFDPRAGSLRGLEEGGTAGDSGFKMIILAIVHEVEVLVYYFCN